MAQPTIAGSRLATVAELVPPGSRVADVASGHGLLARWLVDSERARHCIACDRIPLGTGERYEARTGDGLTPLVPADGIDVIVLAGLGARKIVRILEDDPHGLTAGARLVLQPQSGAAELRGWLTRRRLWLVAEALAVERGRAYPVLAADARAAPPPPHPALSSADLAAVGPWLARSGDSRLARLWARELERCLILRNRVPEGPAARRLDHGSARARRVLAALSAPPRLL